MPIDRLPVGRFGMKRPGVLLLAIAAIVGIMSVVLRATPLRSSTTFTPDFANFEGLQVHPLAVTPDRTRLLAVNTPDARLEVFAIGSHVLSRLGEIPVGLEPLSVSAYNDSIAWVV